MTDFRALCAELVDDLEWCDWPYKLKETIRADIDRARAALADEPAVSCDREPASVAAQPTPAGSLVERVSAAPNDRAKIREVIAYLQENYLQENYTDTDWVIAQAVALAIADLKEEADRG